MVVLFAVVLAAAAGFLEGSFAAPVKYLKRWKPENNWLVFSVFAFFIIPWSVLTLLEPRLGPLFSALDKKIIWILIGGGLSYGLGEVLFATTLRYLDMGVAFLINVASIATFSTLLPLVILEPEKLFKQFGLWQILAILLFICGVVASGFMLNIRKKRSKEKGDKKASNFTLGFILAGISGIFIAIETFAYTYCIPTIRETLAPLTTSLVANNIGWLFIYTAAFIPYSLFFLYLCVSNKNLKLLAKSKNYIYYAVWLGVGLFYFLGVIAFSQSSLMLGDKGSFISWPMFTIFTVLTSNFWGLLQGEWKGAKRKEIILGVINIAFLLLAIAILALNAAINLGK